MTRDPRRVAAKVRAHEWARVVSADAAEYPRDVRAGRRSAATGALSALARGVARALADFASEAGQAREGALDGAGVDEGALVAWPRVEVLAGKCGSRDERGVRAALSDLERAGYLVKHVRRTANLSTVYELRAPTPPGHPRGTAPEVAPGPPGHTPRGLRGTRPGGLSDAPLSRSEPEAKPSSEGCACEGAPDHARARLERILAAVPAAVLDVIVDGAEDACRWLAACAATVEAVMVGRTADDAGDLVATGPARDGWLELAMLLAAGCDLLDTPRGAVVDNVQRLRPWARRRLGARATDPHALLGERRRWLPLIERAERLDELRREHWSREHERRVEARLAAEPMHTAPAAVAPATAPRIQARPPASVPPGRRAYRALCSVRGNRWPTPSQAVDELAAGAELERVLLDDTALAESALAFARTCRLSAAFSLSCWWSEVCAQSKETAAE